MPDYSDLVPSQLKPAWSDGTNLKPSLTTSNYSGGTPTAADEVKPSLLKADGSLKESMLAGGEIKPAIGGNLNVVSNGVFDSDSIWGKGDGWSISGGKAVRVGAAFGSLLSQPVVLEGSTTYQITFDILAISGGSINTRFYGTATQVGASKSTPGEYTTTLNAANNTTFAVGVSAAGVTATIDNIRVVPT